VIAMHAMHIVRAVTVFTLASGLGGCWGGIYESPAAQYVNRSDTITLSAGNAKDVNAATHVIDPWPRYVNDRRIRANGERMVGAVQRYQRPPAPRAQGQGPVGAGANASGPSSGTPNSGSPGAAVSSSTLPF
jgi:hypothetical protein